MNLRSTKPCSNILPTGSLNRRYPRNSCFVSVFEVFTAVKIQVVFSGLWCHYVALR